MDTANLIALFSCIAAVVSALAALISAALANKTVKENRKISASAQEIDRLASRKMEDMFKREFIFELHKTWDGVRDVSKESPVTEDAIRGASILSVTAAIWLHDVMDKRILHQTYGDDYINLYNSLYTIEKSLPCSRKSGRDLLTKAVTRVFNEMKGYNDNLVHGSTMSS
jgi:hypothetical protein